MDRLRRDITPFEAAVFYRVSDFTEMKRLAVVRQDDINLVSDIFWIDGRPLCQAPVAFEACKIFAKSGMGFDVRGMFKFK